MSLVTNFPKSGMNNNGQRNMKNKTAGNMRLAQWGVTSKIESSCFYLALVHIDSLVLLSPPLRQAQKR